MTWFADLSPCDYFEVESSALIAVGWLGAGHAYPQGEVRPEFSAGLDALLAEAWQPMLFCGLHACEFCRREAPPILSAPDCVVETKSGARTLFTKRQAAAEKTEHLDYLNLFVPSEKGLFAAPRMIGHYFTTHRYQPPDVFCAAVMECPPMNSRAYFEAVAACAPAEFVEYIKFEEKNQWQK